MKYRIYVTDKDIREGLKTTDVCGDPISRAFRRTLPFSFQYCGCSDFYLKYGNKQMDHSLPEWIREKLRLLDYLSDDIHKGKISVNKAIKKYKLKRFNFTVEVD